MNVFNRFTNDRYKKNKKVFSFKPVTFPTTLFSYKSLDEKQRNVPDLYQLPIGKLIEDIFSFHEYHVNHSYTFRKKIPSARSIHPFLPIIHVKGNLFLYDALSKEFIYFGYDSSKKYKNELLICADLWRICSVYGEFGLALSFLEFGHILSDMKWLMKSEYSLHVEKGELVFRSYELFMEKDYLLNAKDLYVVSAIQLNDFSVFNEKTKKVSKRKITKIYNYEEELRDLGITKFLKNAQKERISFWKPYEKGLKNLQQRRKFRHSFNHRLGTFSLGFSMEKEEFYYHLRLMEKYIPDWLKRKLSFYFYIHHVKGISKGMYIYKNKHLKLIEKRVDLYSLFYEGRERINVDTLPFLLLVTGKTNSANSLSTFIKSHIYAGEVVHTLSLLYAKKSTFSRPFKNINDLYCQRVCQTKKNEYFLYGCLFGLGEKNKSIPWR